MPAPIPPEQILEAALEVWREEGYRAATTRKIAERAQVGEVTLFRRFGGKADLFAAALAREAGGLADVTLIHTGDLEADMLSIATTYGEIVERNAAIIMDFLRVAPGNTELRSVGAAPLAMVNRLAEIIVRYQSEGLLRSGPPLDLLVALLSPILMTRLLLGAQPGIPLTSDARVGVRSFLAGYSAAPKWPTTL